MFVPADLLCVVCIPLVTEPLGLNPMALELPDAVALADWLTVSLFLRSRLPSTGIHARLVEAVEGAAEVPKRKGILCRGIQWSKV